MNKGLEAVKSCSRNGKHHCLATAEGGALKTDTSIKSVLVPIHSLVRTTEVLQYALQDL